MLPNLTSETGEHDPGDSLEIAAIPSTSAGALSGRYYLNLGSFPSRAIRA